MTTAAPDVEAPLPTGQEFPIRAPSASGIRRRRVPLEWAENLDRLAEKLLPFGDGFSQQ